MAERREGQTERGEKLNHTHYSPMDSDDQNFLQKAKYKNLMLLHTCNVK